ncbi:hypothetical protein AB6N24_08705 [Cellulomonas sp. 179-A 4D5 NHS]
MFRTIVAGVVGLVARVALALLAAVLTAWVAMAVLHYTAGALIARP